MPNMTTGYYVAPVKKGDKTAPGDAKDTVPYEMWEDDLWNAAAKWPDQWFRDDPRKAAAQTAPVGGAGGPAPG